MTRKECRFVTSYVQGNPDETILIIKDSITGKEYLEIISDKGVALAPLQNEGEGKKILKSQ